MYEFPFFIRNQRCKDIFLRRKERKKIIEKYVLFPYFMSNQELKIFSKMVGSRGN